jgi:hypothetical protein
MNRMILMVSMAMATAAAAQTATVTKAPTFKPGTALACPAGTKQMNGAGSTLVGCAKVVDGKPVFHGPVVRLYDSGKVEAMGQLEEGLRTGKWQMFTEAGALTSEIEFSQDRFHGRRVEFGADGKPVLEENYVQGKRQGLQKMVVNGVATVTEFKDDRPVQK